MKSNNNNSYKESINKYKKILFCHFLVSSLVLIICIVYINLKGTDNKKIYVEPENTTEKDYEDNISLPENTEEKEVEKEVLENTNNENNANNTEQISSQKNIEKLQDDIGEKSTETTKNVDNETEKETESDNKIEVILNRDNTKLTELLDSYKLNENVDADRLNAVLESDNIVELKKLVLDYIDNTEYNYILEYSSNSSTGNIIVEFDNEYHLLSYEITFINDISKSSYISEINQISIQIFELEQKNSTQLDSISLTNEVSKVDDKSASRINTIINDYFIAEHIFNLKIYKNNNIIYLDMLDYKMNELNIFKISN